MIYFDYIIKYLVFSVLFVLVTAFSYLCTNVLLNRFLGRGKTMHSNITVLFKYFEKEKDEQGILLTEALGKHLYQREAEESKKKLPKKRSK